MSWDLKYTTHTKGHYGIEDPELKFSKKGVQKDSDKRTKVQRHKVLKWHGNEEQMNTVVCYVLQPCGFHTVSYLKTEVIMKLILWPRYSYLDLRVSDFLSPKDWHQ